MAMAANTLAENVYRYLRDAMHRRLEIWRNGIRWKETANIVDNTLYNGQIPTVQKSQIRLLQLVNLSATCFHVNSERFLACFRVQWVCQRQLGFHVSVEDNWLK